MTFKALPDEQPEIAVTLQYVLQLGKFGKFIAHLFDNPAAKLDEDLTNFKQYVEDQIGNKAYTLGGSGA